jgi:hypothetical protein
MVSTRWQLDCPASRMTADNPVIWSFAVELRRIELLTSSMPFIA